VARVPVDREVLRFGRADSALGSSTYASSPDLASGRPAVAVWDASSLHLAWWRSAPRPGSLERGVSGQGGAYRLGVDVVTLDGIGHGLRLLLIASGEL
jgi:hypothetical protein